MPVKDLTFPVSIDGNVEEVQEKVNRLRAILEEAASIIDSLSEEGVHAKVQVGKAFLSKSHE